VQTAKPCIPHSQGMHKGGSRALLRQDPAEADSREHLRQLLDRPSGGAVFTTIHKFTEAHGTISERANFIVTADGAHRRQYGLVDGGGVGSADGRDRVTARVRECADVYDIRQALADGASVPIHSEPRIVKLTIDEAGAQGGGGEDRRVHDPRRRRRRTSESRWKSCIGRPSTWGAWRSSSRSIGTSAAPRWKARR
jgi:type I site-specific restriction-modification system R (restriction) subunit